MPVYSYSYLDITGRLQQATADAKSQDRLIESLKRKGVKVEAVIELQAISEKPKGLLGKVGLDSLSLFCRQFSAMVDAGVSLIKCLEVLSRQTSDKILKWVLTDIGIRIESGEALSNAMEAHPKIFNRLFIGLVRAGEVGGVLDRTLQRLSVFLEKEAALKRKVKSALVYPAIVIVGAVGVVVFLVVYVVPKFKELFEGLSSSHSPAELPKVTQFLFDLSQAFATGWLNILIWIGVIFVSLKLFFNTPRGRYVADFIKLKLPVFGKLHHKVCMTRFCRTMGTLLSSGVPILQALETVSDAIGNVVIAETIIKAKERIREGEGVSIPLAESKWFPPMVVHMVSVGEESGSLDRMLEKTADFYDSEIETNLESLTAALEPIMIVVLGVIVMFILIAMFSPSVSLMNNLTEQANE